MPYIQDYLLPGRDQLMKPPWLLFVTLGLLKSKYRVTSHDPKCGSLAETKNLLKSWRSLYSMNSNLELLHGVTICFDFDFIHTPNRGLEGLCGT
jgi:hypothetical protein